MPGDWASRAAAIATSTPPTAEKVWNASEITAIDPVHKPMPISITKYTPVSQAEIAMPRPPEGMWPACGLPCELIALSSLPCPSPSIQRAAALSGR